MMVASMLVALALGQSTAPYVRSRVDASDSSTHCLFWTVPTLTWHLSSPGNTASGDAQKELEFQAIRDSFQSWRDVFSTCGNLRIEEGPMVDDREVGYELKGENRNLVLFREKSCGDTGVVPSGHSCWSEDTCGNEFDCWDGDSNTIALTLTTYDEKSGIIYDSDIQLNASDFTFTTVDEPCGRLPTSSCVATDVQNTMTHEIGHLLGLDHTWATGSTMNPKAPPGETSKRTIDQGSRDFVCATYPLDRPSQSCVTPSASARGEAAALGLQAGCTSTGAAAWLPALAGWAALLWQRRRRGILR